MTIIYKNNIIFLLCLFICILSFGIFGDVQSGACRTISFQEFHRQEVSNCEKKGEFKKALISLKILRQLNPRDKKIAQEVIDFEKKIQSKAQQHFNWGVSLYNKKKYNSAEREFLITLRFDPENKEALDYLKYRAEDRYSKFYTSKKNDTLKKIARKIYKDSSKHFLIAYFNGLSSNDRLSQGQRLRVPIIKRTLTYKRAATRTEVSKAEKYIKEEKYEDALDIAGTIRQHDVMNEDASNIEDKANFRLGKKLFNEKKYVEALEIYQKVDSGMPGISEAIADVKKRLKKKAEDHYKNGVKYYLNEELKLAIKEWEKALKLDSNHPKAAKDIEKARDLLNKLEMME